MIEDIGRVVKVQGDQAFIEVERSSACAECGLQEAEEMTAGGKVVFEAFNMIQARVGDRVRVQVQTAAYMKATIYVYGIPVLLMVIGAIFGMYIAGALNRSSDSMSAFFGIGGLLLGIFILFLLRKKGNAKKYIPVVVEVLTEDGAA
jgi:sigma-E factor negative regulatory protein RseC